MLPEELLLLIFEYCADEEQFTKKEMEAWQSLAHVCRQWRSLVFGSARRLNLRLVCTPGTLASDKLDVWPLWPKFPLLIQGEIVDTSGMDNIISALKSSNPVFQIKLAGVSSSQLENLSAAMQRPISELIRLELWSRDEKMPVIMPNSFLGGFVPTLRFLWLARIPIPGLPKLLLSATHLVDLHLLGIPHSGYFSPEAMVTALSTLNSLESLSLKFQSPRSQPRNQRPFPWIRSVLPVVTHFWFKGVSNYLEDFVACIEAPRLEFFDICFFNRILFDIPKLVRFIDRTPALTVPEIARISFERGAPRVNFSSQRPGFGKLIVEISCTEPNWQLSALRQVCASFVPHLPTLEKLYIFEHIPLQPDWQDNIDNVQCMELLHPFSNVKNLYLSEVYPSYIVSAALLEPFRVHDSTKSGGSTYSRSEMLPALQNIFLEGLQPSGPVQKAIRQFVAEREVSDQPIAVYRWDRRTRF